MAIRACANCGEWPDTPVTIEYYRADGTFWTVCVTGSDRPFEEVLDMYRASRSEGRYFGIADPEAEEKMGPLSAVVRYRNKMHLFYAFGES